MTSPRSTIYLKFIFFQVFFNRSSIPDPRFSIPDPSFPVNLEILLNKIILFFDKTGAIACSKLINVFKR